MVKEAITVRFLVILVLVGVVHAGIGGVLLSLSRGGDEPAGPPPAGGQEFEVAPPTNGGAQTGGGEVAPSPPQQSTLVTHTVQPGESYWGIASRYRTTVGELQRINGHAPNHVLQPGQTLKVPRK